MLKGEEPLSTLKRITSYAIIKTALSALTNMRIWYGYAIIQDQLCEISLTAET